MPRVSSPQGNVLQGDEMTGEKFDLGKPRWSLLPRGSIAAIVRDGWCEGLAERECRTCGWAPCLCDQQ